jgi:hypothetical protein
MSDGDAAKLADELERSGHCWCLEKRNRDLIVTALRSLPREAELRRALEKSRDYIEFALEYHGPDAAGKGLAAINAIDGALSSEGQEKKSQSSDGLACGGLYPASRRLSGDPESSPSEALALHEGEREEKWHEIDSAPHTGVIEAKNANGDLFNVWWDQGTFKGFPKHGGYLCVPDVTHWRSERRSPPVSDALGLLKATAQQYGNDAALEDAAEEIARLRAELNKALREIADLRMPLSAAPDTEGR